MTKTTYQIGSPASTGWHSSWTFLATFETYSSSLKLEEKVVKDVD